MIFQKNGILFRYSNLKLRAKNCLLEIWESNSVKSVHFKKTVARSSFLSKLQYFSIQHQLSWHQKKVSWSYIEKYHNFKRNEDRATVFLKWTDFIAGEFSSAVNDVLPKTEIVGNWRKKWEIHAVLLLYDSNFPPILF